MFKVLEIIGDMLTELGALIFVLIGAAGVGLWLDNYMRWTWRWVLVLLGSATMAAGGFLIRRYAARQSN